MKSSIQPLLFPASKLYDLPATNKQLAALRSARAVVFGGSSRASIASQIAFHKAMRLPVKKGRGMTNTLRPYQEKTASAVLAAKDKGLLRVLYVQPTGCGKTVTFSEIIQRVRARDPRPAMVVAHREELLDQAARSVAAHCPGATVSIEKGSLKASRTDIVVASVQTIGRKDSKRLGWLAAQGPSIIIIDECHHAAADGYLNVGERFGSMERTFTVGCTATPKRLDMRALHGAEGAFFQKEVFRYEIRTAIQDGWLCPIRGYRVVSGINLDAIKTTAGDFNSSALADAVNNSARTDDAIDKWLEVSPERQTLVFCCDVQHARDAADAWAARGFSAASIDGSMSGEARKDVLGRLKSGALQVLCNCEILTEGFDHPPISSIVMLRPTQSWSLYCQMTGRGTRLADGKQDLIVIDVVDNCRKHSLAAVPAILDLPPTLDLQGHSLEDAAKKIEDMGAKAACLAAFVPKSFDELSTVLERVDLFANLEPTDDIRALSHLNWLTIPGGWRLDCGREGFSILTQDSVGTFRLRVTREKEIVFDHGLASELPLDIVFRKVDGVVMRTFPGDLRTMIHDSPWRAAPPSDKQINMLRKRFKIDDQIINTLTRGSASGMITQLMASHGGGK